MVVLFRSSEWDTPWWVRPNRAPGRYNHQGAPATQYLCDHPLTVFAERLRGLGQAILADLDTIRWRCWAVQIDPDRLSVIDFATAAEFEITPDQLVDDDWGPCQELAQRCREEGRRGIVVPSAALPGTRNVVLFEPRVATPWLGEPVDLEIESATAHVAEGSIPPLEVVDLVRWHGQAHAELQAWREGRPYGLVDPVPLPTGAHQRAHR